MTEFKRRAEWIWRQRHLGAIPFGAPMRSAGEEKNRYVYFRRPFTLHGSATEATAWVCADGRYQLTINGQLVGRGPSRSQPAWQQVDRLDIRPYLQPGPNVIAALVHSYGRHTAWYQLPEWEPSRAFGCGGFFFQADIRIANEVITLDSDTSWRSLESVAWRRDVPAGSLGFTEIYDVRQAPVGWTTLDFDDATWEDAEILRLPGRQFVNDIVPFPCMIPRDIPQMAESVAWPTAVIQSAEVENGPGEDIAALLEQETPGDLPHCRVTGLENVLREGETAVIQTTDQHSVTITLDFGRIVTGRIRFEVTASEGTILDFTHSERLQADGRVLIHQGIPGFDVKQAHRVILREGQQVWSAFEWAGLRYVQVTVRQAVRPLTIHAITLTQTNYPVQPRGQFACSDDRLNRIWQAGANTVRLCMHDAYVDCPSREQRQYMADGYVQMLTNFAAFGDTRLAARLLRQIAHSQLADGLLMMCAPGDFAALHVINIPDFTLYWVMALGKYVAYSGDTAVVPELYPTLLKALDWFRPYLNEDHLLADVPHWVFVDWAELDKTGQVTALNAQFVAALETAVSLAQLTQHPDDAARWQTLAGQVRQAINRHLWDEARGVYVDNRYGRRISQQSNAAVIAFGVAPPSRWPRILDAILDEDRLILTRVGDHIEADIPFDEAVNVVLAQPFYMHHLHRALRLAGRYDALLENIHRWDTLLADGTDTFRETWQVDASTSLCHGWASTPTFDLSTAVLGITPTSPGFQSFRVAPHPANLTWARGTFPTPLGEIGVDWRLADGRMQLTLAVPEGAAAEVVVGDTAVTVGSGRHEFGNHG
ncbi:MAG: family 78 glycoside hydrolase catalytic domain [Chloroflexi bacterium]|nr:family 78 glycoside hydrolase catalytic domain [Chloroflexota bacterium]